MNAVTWAQAQQVIEHVFRGAATLGVSVSCSVVDADGHEVGTARMENASWFTAGIARTKAQTAVALGRDTSVLANLFAEYPDLLTQIGNQLPFTPTSLPGGVRTSHGHAVGVSGALPEQDVKLAQDAIAHVLNV
jgi:glc operon protein GlcG